MLLKRVEIAGFKSFADKSILDFEPGVTAIVGPNGSGKSNVADAVRWVLGEQSMKYLRGKKGEDVIFVGSNKKGQCNNAIVSLFLKDKEKDGDIIISRKIFRSGESDYQINKVSVRLSDIVDLLARSGISQKGYCVISQGLADEVLRATPIMRREIFDEAAGVKKYQLQKDRSIKKLESTKENLKHIQDLINEIAPRLKTLKIQANRAKQKEEIETKYKELEIEYFKKEWRNISAKEEMANNNWRTFEQNIKKFENEVKEKRHKLEVEEKKFSSGTNNEEEKSRDKLDIIQVKRNGLERELAIIEGKIQSEIERNKEKIYIIPVDANYVSKSLANLLEKLSLVLKLKNIVDAQKNIRLVFSEIENLLKEIKEGKITKKEKIVENQGLGMILIDLKEKKSNLSKNISEINKQIEELYKNIKSVSENDKECRDKFFQLEKDLRQQEFELSKMKDRFRSVELEKASVNMQKEEIARRMRSYGINYKDIEKNIGEIKEEYANKSVEYLFEELNKTKIKMDQIGGIDPLVIKEYEETNERFEFLNNQSDDLLKAINSLKKVIKDLAEQIEVKFNVAFSNINEQFNKYFRILFGGGLAGLQKVEIKKFVEKEHQEDGKEINENEREEIKSFGIEIKVSLPGKKVKELEMLSGGERALTSIAILFAIVSNDPPPFAVLDEVDASLDESNSYKLASILKDFQSTQFVIITHNREMMRQSHTLYGVTMQDDGVSKLLSMKL